MSKMSSKDSKALEKLKQFFRINKGGTSKWVMFDFVVSLYFYSQVSETVNWNV